MTQRPITIFALFTSLSFSWSNAARGADILPPTPAKQGYNVEEDSKDGLYIALRGGYNSLDDTTINYFVIPGTPPNPPVTTRALATYRGDYTYSGAIGYDFGEFTPGLGARIEVEVGQLNARVRSQTLTTSRGAVTSAVTGFSGGLAGGTTSATTGLVNYYVEALLGPFKPFATLGIGVTNASFRNHSAGDTSLINSSRVTWAWAGGGGIGYDITDNLTLEVAYRYLELRDVRVTSSANQSTKTDIRNQQATVGLRVRF